MYSKVTSLSLLLVFYGLVETLQSMTGFSVHAKEAINDCNLHCPLECVFGVMSVTASSDKTDFTAPTWFGVDLLFLDLGLVTHSSVLLSNFRLLRLDLLTQFQSQE